VTNTESILLGIALTVALKFSGTLSTACEGFLQEHKSDKPKLSKRLNTKHLRSCGFLDKGDGTFTNVLLARNTVLTIIKITCDR
jgi:hypothetical protein